MTLIKVLDQMVMIAFLPNLDLGDCQFWISPDGARKEINFS